MFTSKKPSTLILNQIPLFAVTNYTGITTTNVSSPVDPISNMFDGDTNTGFRIGGAGNFIELDWGGFQKPSNAKLEVLLENGNDVGDDNIDAYLDGVLVDNFDVSAKVWYEIAASASWTTFRLECTGSTQATYYAFEINDSQLVDA